MITIFEWACCWGMLTLSKPCPLLVHVGCSSTFCSFVVWIMAVITWRPLDIATRIGFGQICRYLTQCKVVKLDIRTCRKKMNYIMCFV